jgi:CAAX protease family protein
MKKNPSASVRLSSPWLYFIAVLAWTWFFWLLDVVLGLGQNTASGMLLLLIGLLGPMLGGILFTYLTRDKAGRRDYWSRIFNPGRIPAKWFLVIFLLAPVLMLIAALLDILTGGSLAPFQKIIAPFLAQPGMLIPLALSVFFLGPFPEEFGWRGYMLDRLQSRWSALKSSLILGVIWASWHWPLFFIKDTYQ